MSTFNFPFRRGVFIKGYPGRIKQSTTKRYDPTNGEVVQIEWAGAGKTLTGYAGNLKQIGIPFEHTLSGVISRLVETATDEIAVESPEVTVTQRFDIIYNEQMLDIKESPNWVGLTSTTQKGQVLKDVERHFDGKPIRHDWEDTDPGIEATLQAYFNLMISGVTHYPTESWVLRHTYNIPGDTTQGRSGLYPASIDQGIGSVYTTGQVQNMIPDTYARVKEKIGNISLPARSGFIVGWRKRPTSETTVANNRIEVGAEYTYAQYPAVIFSLA
jgi:hypothetical protein